MAVKSRNEGKMIEIDPALYTFDFPVPSFYEYDPWDEADQANAVKIAPEGEGEAVAPVEGEAAPAAAPAPAEAAPAAAPAPAEAAPAAAPAQ